MSTVPSSETLGAVLRRGARWVIAGQITSQLISLVTLALLYRLLAPAEFGLFGMALPWVLIPRTLATLGLSAATIQRHSLNDDERAQLFWMQTALGAVMTVVTLFLAQPAAHFYGVIEVAPLIRALAATVLLASLAATHQALLERQLQLPRVMLIRLFGQVLGAAAAIAAARQQWGAQALVVQQYGELLALLLASWGAAPWLPQLPRWRTTAWQEFATFGGLYSLSSLLFVLAQNVDKLLLGMWLGDSPAGQAVVGAYTQAYNLALRPVYLITTPLTGMLLPALSRMASDERRFAQLTNHAFRLTADTLLPMSVGVWFVAVEAMTVLGGPHWRDAGALLSALAPLIAMQGWINLCGSALAARGKAALLCFGATVSVLITAQATLAGYLAGRTAWGGPLGCALGVATALAMATTFVLGLPYVSVMLAASRVSPRAILLAALPAMRATIAMGLVVAITQWLSRDLGVEIRLAIVIASGVACYTALMRSELRWLWQLARPGHGVVTRVQEGGSLAGNDSSDAS